MWRSGMSGSGHSIQVSSPCSAQRRASHSAIPETSAEMYLLHINPNLRTAEVLRGATMTVAPLFVYMLRCGQRGWFLPSLRAWNLSLRRRLGAYGDWYSMSERHHPPSPMWRIGISGNGYSIRSEIAFLALQRASRRAPREGDSSTSAKRYTPYQSNLRNR